MTRIATWSSLARAPRRDIQAFQDAALAKHVREDLYPFSAHYRKVFDDARVSPRDIRTVADLRKLPLSGKADIVEAAHDPKRNLEFILAPSPHTIREHWPFARKIALALGGARARETVRRDYTPHFLTFTTGRSSEPVSFAYTPYDIDILAEAGARMMDVHGVPTAGSRVLNLFPFAPHLAFWAAAWASFRTGLLMISSGGGKVLGTAGNLKLAERLKPTVLIGTPGFVYHLLREAAGSKAGFSQVKTVVLGAEKVAPGLKLKMAEVLESCGARDVIILGTYGFTEARMAFAECPAAHDVSTGYHLYPDLGVFETIHPETLEPVGEGQTGELVYTPIAGHGTVVCRYRTGDVAVGGITWEPCPRCGRTVPRITSDLRRSSDQKTASLTKIKGTLVDLPSMGLVLSAMPEVEEWQIVLKKLHDDPHDLDEFVVRAALKAGADTAAFEKKAREELLARCEIAPNRFEILPMKEMLAVLGMETEMKEKRFLDMRPK